MKSKSLPYRILKFNRLGIKMRFKKTEFNFELYHLMKYLKSCSSISWKTALNDLKMLAYDDVPLSYIIRAHPFLNTNLSISQKVLIPRNETEEYIMALITQIKSFQLKNLSANPIQILDLCSGSGCISLALACNLKRVELTAVDNLSRCCINSRTNINRNMDMMKSMESLVHVIQGDVFSEDLKLDQKFDLIISNPPYIPRNKIKRVDSNVLKFESHTALFPTTCIRNGIQFHSRILSISQTLLRKSSDNSKSGLPKIILEIDGKDQIGPLKRVLKSLNLKNYYFRNDLRKFPRSLWVY
jgi:HemK-like putative methylase